MSNKLISYEEAAGLVESGSTVATTSFGLSALPEKLLVGLKERYEREQQPRDLTFLSSASLGNGVAGRGLDHLAAEGLLKTLIISHISLSPIISQAITAGQFAAYFMPQGTLAGIYQATARRSPGVITKVGLHTFIDPRLEGGRANDQTREDLIELVELDGEEWLKYPKLPVDTAFIRGTYADESGNISFEHESGKFEALSLATNARNSGGIVIAQVERVVKDGSLPPKNILVPGMLVDYVITSEKECHAQTAGTSYHPAFSNEIQVPRESIDPMPLDIRKIIARRAAMELSKGDIVNLGFGMPDGVAAIAQEEGVYDDLLLTLDIGTIGGIPARGLDYGGVYNAEAVIGHTDMMDFYDGGGLDLAVLSFGQVDPQGNVNVSKLGSKLIGPGGFINISQTTDRVVFVGQHTVGGKYEIADGKLVILEQGKYKKFVEAVDQVTFSGAYAKELEQKILYVTERAVFDLHEGRVRLIETAPGLDLKRDILDWMDFQPLISDNLKEMNTNIFQEKWGELRALIK